MTDGNSAVLICTPCERPIELTISDLGLSDSIYAAFKERKALATDAGAFTQQGHKISKLCRSLAKIVETPQDSKRALRRMDAGGLGRNRTTDTRIFNPYAYPVRHRPDAHGSTA